MSGKKKEEAVLHDQNTYNFTFLAGSSLQFPSLVLLANHSHMCKCWVSNPERENVGSKKFNVSETGI